jgi:hypothetical protein
MNLSLTSEGNRLQASDFRLQEGISRGDAEDAENGGFGEWERGRLGDGGETIPFLKPEV